MTGIIVGSVGVSIYPDTKTFWGRFKAETRAGAEAASRDLGQQISQSLPRQISQGVNRGLQTATVQSRRLGGNAGQSFGDEFGRTVTSRIQAAIRALPDKVELNANITPAQAQLELLRQEINGIGDALDLGIDTSDAQARLEVVRLELASLSRNSPDIRVRINSAAALAEIKALEAALTGVSDVIGDPGDPGSGGGGGGAGGGRSGVLGKRLAVILKLIAQIGPALIPIGGAAVGALGVAGVAVAALGFALGGLYLKTAPEATKLVLDSFQGLTDAFRETSKASARAIAPELASGMTDIAAKLPAFRDSFAAISKDLGTITANAGVGFLSIVKAFIPLTLNVADNIAKWSAGLRDVGQTQGFQDFVGYVTRVMPQVRDFFKEFGSAISQILQAFAPWGSIVLTSLTLLSTVIDAIPLPVLKTLALIFESYLAFGLVSKIVNGVAASFQLLSAATFVLRASAAGGSLTSLFSGLAGGASLAQAATAGVTVALVAGLYIWQKHKQRVEEAKQAISQYTNALIEDNGVIGENTRKLAIKELSEGGLFKSANRLGIQQSTLTDAYLGQAGALERLRVVTDAAFAASENIDTSKASEERAKDAEAADKLVGALKDQGIVLKDSKQNYIDQTQAMLDGLPVRHTLIEQYASLTGVLGISLAAVKSYGSALALTDDSSAAAAGQIKALANLYATANPTVAALADATLEFGASQGKAADQSAFLAAQLIAMQGPNLGYAQAISAGTSATNSFVSSFSGDGNETARQGLRDFVTKLEAIGGATTDVAAIQDLYSGATAPAVVNALAAMQSGAATAAKGYYEMNLQTLGAQGAAAGAAEVFKGQSYDALMANYQALGLTSDQAKILADTYFNMPPLAETDVVANGLESVNATLQTFALTLANLNGKRFQSYVQLDIATNGTTGSAAQYRAAEQATQGLSANGNIYEPTIGRYADGAHVAGIFSAQPDMRIFAEPETGGEAYIPMHLNKRSRSTAILSTVADKFGYNLVPSVGKYATGGLNVGIGNVSVAPAQDGSLIAELRALRAELAAQTGALVGATYGAAESATRSDRMGSR